MGYEQQFLEARKEYHQKIQTFMPSKALMAIIDEDKPKQLAHKLDENKGKPYRQMDEALNVFDAYRLTYIKKITDQMAHESQAAKIKPTINLLMAKLEKMVDGFQKETDDRRKADVNLAKAQAAEAKDVKDDLKKVAEEYKKRGEDYLSKASKLEKDFLLARKLIKDTYLETKSKFDQLQPVAQSGKAKPEQLEEIAKVRTKRVAALKNLKESWDKWKKSFKELEDLAHTDSQLTPEDVAKEMRMKLDDKDAKLELDKAHKANARFFSRATEIYNDISRDRKADSTLIKQTETWVSQIEKWPTAKT
jgi:hypothetical protein